jgi:hypothetical protein
MYIFAYVHIYVYMCCNCEGKTFKKTVNLEQLANRRIEVKLACSFERKIFVDKIYQAFERRIIFITLETFPAI